MSHRSVSTMHRCGLIAITLFLLTACANQAAPTAAPLALSSVAVTQTAPATQANQTLPVTATSTPEPTPTATSAPTATAPPPSPTPTATFTPPPPEPPVAPTATPEQPRVEVDFDNPKIRMFYLNHRNGNKEMLPLGILDVKDYPNVSVVSQESVDYSLVQQLLSGIVVARPHVDGRFLVIPFAIRMGGGTVYLNVHLSGGRFGRTPVRPNLGAEGYFADTHGNVTSRAIGYDDFVREAEDGLQYVLVYYGGDPDAMGAFLDAKLKTRV